MMRSVTLFVLLATLGLRVAGATAIQAVAALHDSHTYQPQAIEVRLNRAVYVGKAPGLLSRALPSMSLTQGAAPALSVFPNPAHGQTTVQISGTTGLDYQLRLSNVLGGEVRRMPLRPESQPADGVALDLSNLPPGLYFCSLLSNDKTLVTKRLTVL